MSQSHNNSAGRSRSTRTPKSRNSKSRKSDNSHHDRRSSDSSSSRSSSSLRDASKSGTTSNRSHSAALKSPAKGEDEEAMDFTVVSSKRKKRTSKASNVGSNRVANKATPYVTTQNRYEPLANISQNNPFAPAPKKNRNRGYIRDY